MLSVYISCHAPQPANDLASAVVAAGHRVCSLWHSEPSPRPAPDAAKEWGEKAANNFHQIRSADVLVVIAKAEQPRKVTVDGVEDYFGQVPGGKFVEAGFARGIGKAVCVVGRVENGMLYHLGIKRFADTAAFLDWLKTQ